MKILLVFPPQGPRTVGGDEFFIYEPLALEYLAAAVSDHHDVRVLDMRLDRALDPVLADFAPDVVGITAYTVHVYEARALAARVKAWSPEAITVVGGHHATVAPDDFHTPDIDLIVVGEGVAALREIVRRLEQGRSLTGVPNVIDRRAGETRCQSMAPLGDLDDVPVPDRRVTAAYRSRYFCDWMQPLASIRTSKGCPFRCSFCTLWKLTGGRYLVRDPDRIVAELADLEEEYVFFADDESLVSAKRMRVLADRIAAAGIRKRFFLYGRSDTIVRHPDLIERWQEVGLERVFVGLESFRDADLERVNKRSSVALNEQALDILAGLGLDVYASFIVRPDYTRDDFRAFRDYCRSLPLNYMTFSVLTPLPGTDLMAELEDRLILRDFDCFDFFHTLVEPALGLDAFYEELYRLYRRAFAPRQMWSLLRRFPLRRLPRFLRDSDRALRRLRRLPRDYAQPGAA